MEMIVHGIKGTVTLAILGRNRYGRPLWAREFYCETIGEADEIAANEYVEGLYNRHRMKVYPMRENSDGQEGEDMPVYITKHVAEHLRERIGIGKKALQWTADTAFEKGLKHSETTGNLKKWVTFLYFNNRVANNIRLYNDKAWIFAEDRLMTVIQIPASLKKSFKEATDRKKVNGGEQDGTTSNGDRNGHAGGAA